MKVFIPVWITNIEQSGPAFKTFTEAFEWLANELASEQSEIGSASKAEVEVTEWGEETFNTYNKMFNGEAEA